MNTFSNGFRETNLLLLELSPHHPWEEQPPMWVQQDVQPPMWMHSWNHPNHHGRCLAHMGTIHEWFIPKDRGQVSGKGSKEERNSLCLYIDVYSTKVCEFWTWKKMVRAIDGATRWVSLGRKLGGTSGGYTKRRTDRFDATKRRILMKLGKAECLPACNLIQKSRFNCRCSFFLAIL